MLTIILLSIGLPVLAGTAYLALRDRRPQFFADARGIALQTVIIMVVLLAIAGTVAGVLLARGGDVTSQLESQEVVTRLVTNQSTCQGYDMGGVAGSWASSKCTWTAAANGVTPADVTRSRCDLVRGTYKPGTASAKATCEVTP